MDLFKLISVDDYEELKQLAEIGKAAEKAFSQAACLEIFEPEYAEINNADQLVEWAKEVVDLL